ncbi:Uncharacterised protein [Vibrio cholerae]|uniref:Uncharacterized protein n=1 Tax=Vibrio cholerae TaxID=666 RepID=A0A655YLI7_VIBCL|nr:Uncharacterised protein [Vibrio cholerae]
MLICVFLVQCQIFYIHQKPHEQDMHDNNLPILFQL